MDSTATDTSTTVLDGGMVVDDATGEILEWPDGITDKLEYLAMQHRAAAEQEKGWEFQKGFWSRLLDRALAEVGTKKYAGSTVSVTAVAGSTTRKAPATAVVAAAAAELITADESIDLLLRAAKELDIGEVDAWIGEQAEARRKPLRLVLIQLSDRKGYVTTRATLQVAPAKVTAKIEGTK